MISIVFALIVASLPVAGVLAAPDGDQEGTGNLELEWSNKVRSTHYENLFYNRVQLLPADFKDRDDLAEAREILRKYGVALKQANEIVIQHTGFDDKGHILDFEDADQSVKDLSMYLHTLRGLREKLDEGDYKIRLSK